MSKGLNTESNNRRLIDPAIDRPGHDRVSIRGHFRTVSLLYYKAGRINGRAQRDPWISGE